MIYSHKILKIHMKKYKNCDENKGVPCKKRGTVNFPAKMSNKNLYKTI